MCMCVSAAFFLLSFSTATNTALGALRGMGPEGRLGGGANEADFITLADNNQITNRNKNIPCPGPYFTRTVKEIINCDGPNQYVFELYEGFYCCTMMSTSSSTTSSSSSSSSSSVAVNPNGSTQAMNKAADYWKEVGQDMWGEGKGDKVGLGEGNGSGLALSGDGTILAVGSRFNDNVGKDAGHVVIYRYGDFGWQPWGDVLTGRHGGEYFGFSLALNVDGTVLAVGSVRHSDAAGIYQGQVCVYQMPKTTSKNVVNNNHPFPGRWVMEGDICLVGDNRLDHFGHSVSLSRTGRILAVGAVQHIGGTNLGYVHVYEYTGAEWALIGDPIMSEQEGDQFGNAVSLSDSGYVVAVGARLHNGINGNDSGMVQIYHFHHHSWHLLGPVLYGEGPEDQFGGSLSLSWDGLTVAVGAEHNDGGDKDSKPSSGHVRVFKYYSPSDTWKQLGPDIDGEGDGHGAGVSVSLGANRVAVGAIYAPNRDTDVADVGQVRVFEYHARNNAWDQVGETMQGVAKDDHMGHSVALNHDGTRLAVSVPHADTANGFDSGIVRVYDYTEL